MGTIPPTPLALQKARIAHRTIISNLMSFSGFDDVQNKFVKFTFILNPSRLQVSNKKDGKWVRTKFGYERQNWGNSIKMFQYSGISGVFKPTDNFNGSTFDVRQTRAYKKFQEFEQFWQNTGNSQRLLSMQYWGYEGEFVGAIDDFQITHDANTKPYEFGYSFKFEAVPLRPTLITASQQLPGETDPSNLALPATDQLSSS